MIRERKAINVRFDGPRLLRRLALHLFRARLSPCRVHKRVAGIVAWRQWCSGRLMRKRRGFGNDDVNIRDGAAVAIALRLAIFPARYHGA